MNPYSMGVLHGCSLSALSQVIVWTNEHLRFRTTCGQIGMGGEIVKHNMHRGAGGQ